MREVLLYLVALIFLLSGLSHALERKSPETYELLKKEEERPKVIEEGEMEEEEREEEEEEPSTIERLFGKRYGEEPLRQFGYDLFRGEVPSVQVPVGDSYVLGPGDELAIYFWGDPVEILDLQSFYTFEIDREGKVFIPSVGVVYAWGMTLGELESVLRERLSKKFRNFSIEVSVGRLRSFPVYVTGFVKKPGPVEAKGINTVLDVLLFAGGVSKNGSLRRVILRRGEDVKEIDLYRFLVSGEPVDVRVRDGDVVYVPPIGKTVAVAGAVKRPAIYELKGERTLAEVLELAGGTLPSAYSLSVRILRYEGDRPRAYESSLSEAENFPVSDGDLIIVGGVFELVEGVRVEGTVAYPGTYSLREVRALSDLLPKIGILPDTNVYYAEILRREPPDYRERVITFSPIDVLEGRKDITLMDLDIVRFYPRWVYEPIYVSGEVERPVVVPFHEGITLLDVLREVKLKGELHELKAEIFSNGSLFMTVYLHDLLVKGEENIELEPGERVVVRKKEPTEKDRSVTVLGEVKEPGVYKLRPGMTLYDLILEAGGYTHRAYPKGIVFIRESAKRLQEEQLRVALSVLEESVVKAEEGLSLTGPTPEERTALRLTLERQKELLKLIKERARLGLGRVALDLPDTLEELKDSPDNITLEEGDLIYVPARPNYVLVLGGVYNQVSIPYIKGKPLSYYLAQVGGPSKEADLDNIYVIKANGRVISRRNWGRFLTFRWEEGKLYFGRSFMDMPLDEGDTIVVPTELKVPVMWRPLIRDVVQIIFQAISTAVLAKRL